MEKKLVFSLSYELFENCSIFVGVTRHFGTSEDMAVLQLQVHKLFQPPGTAGSHKSLEEGSSHEAPFRGLFLWDPATLSEGEDLLPFPSGLSESGSASH